MEEATPRKKAGEKVRRYFDLSFPFLVGFLCLFLQSAVGVTYTETDNLTTAMIVNGLFGEDNYCLVMHPFFCKILGVLAKLFEKADVFACTTQLFVLIAMIWSAYLIIRESNSLLSKAIILAFFLYLTLVVRIYSVNFLTQAGFIGFAGTLSLYKADSFSKRWVPASLGVLLFSMAMMLRNEVGLVFIPFITLGILSAVLRGGDLKNKAIEEGKIVLPLVVAVLFLQVYTAAFYSKEPYKSAREYNSARAIVEDYPMREWDEIEQKADFSLTEYKAAVMWTLIDTDTLDLEKMREIGLVGSKLEEVLSVKNLGKSLSEMRDFLKNNGLTFTVFWVIPLLMLLYLLVRGDGALAKISAVLAVLGAFLILLYFTTRGRAPLRVWQSILFASAAVLLSIPALPAEGLQKTFLLVLEGGATALLCVILLDSAFPVEFHRIATPLNARENADETVFSETFRDNIICIWGGWDGSTEEDGNFRISNYLGGWYSNVSNHYIYQCKLPSREFLEHNIPIGEWFYQWPCFNEHLERIGAKNPAKALLEREDVFFINGNGIEEFNDYLKAYMDEHFGEVTFVDAGVVGENHVYKIFPTAQ